ncbi:hypothetical protein BBP40_000928 [Aspergillus hancockii]|nr:hypothetical protein BBP40_000928 [Aspergillus hancockii]
MESWHKSTSMITTDDRGIIEAGLDEKLALNGLEMSDNGFVRWRRDSRDHPRNWPAWRKAYDTTVIMFLEFYTTAISTTGPFAAELAQMDYGASRITLLIAFSLMYQIGQALGGLVIPPVSELFGRRMPYLLSCLLFSLSCLIVAAVPHISAVFIGRFLSGIASAVPSVVISGSVEDQFNWKHRVWIVLLWNAAATAGLAFGPIYASCIASVASWRWFFYSAAIVTAANNVLLLGIRESRPSQLLARKVASIMAESPGLDLKYDCADPFPTWTVFIDVVLVRSSRMMVTEPILIIVSALSSISWGIVYLFSESLVPAYTALGVPHSHASWPFIAMIIGVVAGLLPHAKDMRVLQERREQNINVEPEDKVMGGFACGTVALAVASLVLVGYGVNEVAYTLSGYLTDTYTVYAASAFAGLAFARALVAERWWLWIENIDKTLSFSA